MFDGKLYGVEIDEITRDILRAAPRNSERFANFMAGYYRGLALIVELRDAAYAEEAE